MDFIDRWGSNKYLDNLGMVIEKQAVYAMLVCDGKVLVTYPPFAVDTPEFPGGGIEEREDIVTSLARELYEETGIEYVFGNPKNIFEQVIGFFADYIKPNGEYWNYHQQFWRFDIKDNGSFKTDKSKWKTPEGGYAEWVDLESILEIKYFNETHRIAVKSLIL